MPQPLAEVLVLVVAAYLAVGAVFAPLFLWRGVGRVDPAAAASGLGFRAIILPGVVLLWPVAARMWARGDRGPPPLARPETHRRRHLVLWALIGPVALGGLALALWGRTGSSAAPLVMPDQAGGGR